MSCLEHLFRNVNGYVPCFLNLNSWRPSRVQEKKQNTWLYWLRWHATSLSVGDDFTFSNVIGCIKFPASFFFLTFHLSYFLVCYSSKTTDKIMLLKYHLILWTGSFVLKSVSSFKWSMKRHQQISRCQWYPIPTPQYYKEIKRLDMGISNHRRPKREMRGNN